MELCLKVNTLLKSNCYESIGLLNEYPYAWVNLCAEYENIKQSLASLIEEIDA